MFVYDSDRAVWQRSTILFPSPCYSWHVGDGSTGCRPLSRYCSFLGLPLVTVEPSRRNSIYCEGLASETSRARPCLPQTVYTWWKTDNNWWLLEHNYSYKHVIHFTSTRMTYVWYTIRSAYHAKCNSNQYTRVSLHAWNTVLFCFISDFTLLKATSAGLRSGEYGGRKINLAPIWFSTTSVTSSTWCIEALSSTIYNWAWVHPVEWLYKRSQATPQKVCKPFSVKSSFRNVNIMNALKRNNWYSRVTFPSNQQPVVLGS